MAPRSTSDRAALVEHHFLGLPHGSVHALRVQRRRRSAFEVSYGVPMVADEVVLQLEAQVNNVDPSGRFSTEVTFGKKPGSIDPKDSFAGWLHEVQVSIG